jgi:hypothetical protein
LFVAELIPFFQALLVEPANILDALDGPGAVLSSALSSSPVNSACSEKVTISRMFAVPASSSSPMRSSQTAMGERAIDF